MEKAYDVSDLVARLKSKGLDVAEDAAKMATGEIFDWLVDSAKLSPSVLDDVAVVILPKLKEKVLELEDKIDGEVG